MTKLLLLLLASIGLSGCVAYGVPAVGNGGYSGNAPYYGGSAPYYGSSTPYYGATTPYYGSTTPYYGSSPYYGTTPYYGAATTPHPGTVYGTTEYYGTTQPQAQQRTEPRTARERARVSRFDRDTDRDGVVNRLDNYPNDPSRY